jgi:long-subunit fatty acid transport protein
MTTQQRALCGTKLMFIISALSLGIFVPGMALGGGLIAYEIGTADVGLASAGYNARAQDASTVFTNPAGMTRLEGTQVLAAGQIEYGRTQFSIGSGTLLCFSHFSTRSENLEASRPSADFQD